MKDKNKKAETEIVFEEKPIEKVETEKVKELVFTKDQLLSAKKYRDRRDALNALLDDDRSYTISETDKLLNDFLKRKISS